MPSFRVVWIFHRKLLLQSVTSSLMVGLLGTSGGFGFHQSVGLSYIFFSPLFHFFIYELRYPNEYYFYFNLGLSKSFLWSSTVIMSLVPGIITALL